MAARRRGAAAFFLLLVLLCWRGEPAGGSEVAGPSQQQLDAMGSGFVPSGRMCEEGGYCSVGVSKVWQGDIGPSENLRAMLEAVSYKKEIIVTVLTAADEQTVWLDPILQLHWDLERHGYAHLVVHTTEPSTCEELNKFQRMSCIWDGSPSLKGDKDNRHGVWYVRWKFFARAGRLGYNVMNIDGDTIWFRDPYVHFKRFPMSDLQMHCNFEGGGPLHCNGGFIYIQNVLPNGPISWVFKMVVDDQMWMMDDNYTFVNAGGGLGGKCHKFDQELIYDGVKSAFVGRPLHWDFFVDCRPDSWKTENRFGVQLSKQDVLTNIKAMMASGRDHLYWNESQVMPPRDWMPSGYSPIRELTRQLVNQLTVPNLRYGWPSELGGPIGPGKRDGPYSKAWQATLKSDCPKCPWWDEDRPIKDDVDRLDVPLGPNLNGEGGKYVHDLFWDKDVPVELLGIGPAWLSNSMTGYRDGVWAGPGEQGIGHTTAIGHVHHWPQISSWHKTVVRKITGRYNWTLGALTAPHHTPYTSGYPVDKVLALHPSIDLSRTRTATEYFGIVLGLIQVAHLTQRTVLLPDIPCETSWIHNPDMRLEWPCKMPTNQDRDRWPQMWSVPYGYDPKDPTRQLVGGWLRRLLRAITPGSSLNPSSTPPTPSTTSTTSITTTAAAASSSASAGATPGSGPSSAADSDATTAKGSASASARRMPGLILPGLGYVADVYGGSSGGGSGSGGGAVGLPLPPQLQHSSSSSSSPASSTASSSSLGGGGGGGGGSAARRRWGRLLQALYRTPEQRGAFWKDKKFMFSISHMADFECTRDIGNPGGIMAHELAHWLTTSKGKLARLTPDETNTALPLAKDASTKGFGLLNLPEMEHGRVRVPAETPGWSVADTQVLLPAGQVVVEMSRFSDVPLVYLGTPVALVSSKERHKRGDTHDHGNRHHSGGGITTTSAAGAHATGMHTIKPGDTVLLRGDQGLPAAGGESAKQAQQRQEEETMVRQMEEQRQQHKAREEAAAAKQAAKDQAGVAGSSAGRDTRYYVTTIGVTSDGSAGGTSADATSTTASSAGGRALAGGPQQQQQVASAAQVDEVAAELAREARGAGGRRSSASRRKVLRYEWADRDGVRGKLIGSDKEGAGGPGMHRLTVKDLDDMLGEIMERVSGSGCFILRDGQAGEHYAALDTGFPHAPLALIKDHHVTLFTGQEQQQQGEQQQQQQQQARH